MGSLLADLRYALRLLRREPGYTLVATITMALGIGATTTLFSVAYGTLMKPLPWTDADRLMRVTESRKGQQGRIRGTIINGSYLAWRDASSTTTAIGGYSLNRATMTVAFTPGAEPARIAIDRLTPSMFQVLDVGAYRGRVFADGDATAGPGRYPDPQVILLSYGLWNEQFAGRDDAVGRTIHVDDMPVTIIGVMSRTFAFPDREARAWLPMPVGSVIGSNNVRRMQIFGSMARLKPGVTPQQASAEATARARSAPDPGMTAVAMFGSSAPPDVTLTPAVEAMTADVRPAIVLLLAAVILLLAAATANVGSLQLARALTRRRELAICAALGSGGARLVRQLVAESLVVGLAGGAAGLLLTLALHRALPALLPADFPRAADIGVNLPVLAIALTASLVTSVACGLLPAATAMRVDLVHTLVENGAASTGGAWRARSGRLHMLVMAGQIAVACVLLVGAALLARSFVALIRADRGYEPANVLTARIDLPRRYDDQARVTFADVVVDRLRGAPGVASVATANALPFLTLGGNVGFEMPSPSNPGVKQQVEAITRLVHQDYRAALGLRLLQGRFISGADTASALPVIVVSRSFAARYLGASPVGQQVPIHIGDRRDWTVVGVVDDVRQAGVTDAPTPEIFISYRQMAARLVNSVLVVVMRTTGDPTAQVPALRTAVHELDAGVALDSVMTMEERVATSLAKPRLYAWLLGAFAGAALTIAGVGLFGVLSYGVAQRRREIGVRMALGAQVRDVVALVARQAFTIAAAGAIVGLVAAFALARYAQSLLYGVGRFDVLSYAAVAAAVTTCAAVACVIPARRAARVSPLDVLRAI